VIDALAEVGRAAGLDALGVAPAAPFEATRRILEERKAQGLAAGMQFTYRRPARSTDPNAALDGARSLVVGAVAYAGTGPEPSGAAPADRPEGRVARYARADYYATLRSALTVVSDHLRAHGWRTRVLADDNALVDREAAYRAGLGWYGKSANLLLPGRGSWFVLGSVVTDAPLPASDAPVPDGCGPCNRCIDHCPTEAIIAPGVVDARRCLAWLVQAPGSFPIELREALGNRIYGCDDCQEVCPPNRRADLSTADESTLGGPATAPGGSVSLIAMLDADDGELLAAHGRWYIASRDPRYLRRNALVALGNVGDRDDPDVRRVLARSLASADPLLREHAAWAAARLGLEPHGKAVPA